MTEPRERANQRHLSGSLGVLGLRTPKEKPYPQRAHHADIDRGNEQVFRRPDSFMPFELGRRRNLDVGFPGRRHRAIFLVRPANACVIGVALAPDFHIGLLAE